MALRLNPNLSLSRGLRRTQSSGTPGTPPVARRTPISTSVEPADLANVTLPASQLSVGRATLGQRLQRAFNSLALPVLAATMGAMVLTAPTAAQAQVRTGLETSVAAPVREAFEAPLLTEYGLFKFFWDSPSTAEGGLANRGEFELSSTGVAKLLEYAQTHDLKGRQTERQEVSPAERALIKNLIEHPHYGAFIEQGALPELQRAFGLPVDVAHAVVGTKPAKVGDIELPRNVSTFSLQELREPFIRDLGKKFDAEYQSRRDFFEDPNASAEEKSARVLGLYADYVAAIRSYGQLDATEPALETMQERLQAKPFWSVLGTKDFNGAGWSVVESIGLGLDPNAFKSEFPEATANAPVNHFSLNGAMAGPMAKVDLLRVAAGLAPAAADYESLTVLNFLVGQDSGHKKVGTFNERTPFASSGVNWGLLLFPHDAQIASLKPKPGFEFPIDAIDAFGIAFNNDPALGDRIKVVDENKNPLRVQKEIQEEGGKPVSWSARFFRADGTEVEPSKVVGLIVGAADRVKGDGLATANLDMSYWGKCNNYTAQAVYKASYGIPQIDAEVVRIAGADGKIIELTKSEAQQIFDADIEALVPRVAYAGFRFSGLAQTITLTDGSSLIGTVQDYKHMPTRHTVREGADEITVWAAPEQPFIGSILLTVAPGSVSKIDPRLVVAVREMADGKLEFEARTSAGSDNTMKYSGTLERPFSFDGAPVEDGVRVVRPTAERPIVGDIAIKLDDGTTKMVPADQVRSISGETDSDIRPSDFIAMVSLMHGVYATDASKGTFVSNGARSVNRIETIVEYGAHRPAWIKGSLTGIYGPLERQDGDKMLYRRGSVGAEGSGNVTFAVWHQLDSNGRVINEGWSSGEPDFLWGSTDKLQWGSPSFWNPHLPSDVRLKILVNGVTDIETLAPLAERLNLPANWRELRTPAAPAAPAAELAPDTN